MKSAAKHVCNYAVLRFQPYPETEEFVNLGVAMHCPDLGMFKVRLEHARYKRVTDFFPELDKAQFLAARKAVEAEFDRVQKLVVERKDAVMSRHVFRELVRPRESIFRFGEIRTILTGGPAALADELFDRYVQRHFARQKEYQETVMAKRYFEVLQKARPDVVFHRDRVIGDPYRIKLPICSDAKNFRGAPQRAIKPLDLNKPDPTLIVEHGDTWTARLRRLKEMKLMPDRFIFALKEPEAGYAEIFYAATEVKANLEEQGCVVVDADDTDRLVALAADD